MDGLLGGYQKDGRRFFIKSIAIVLATYVISNFLLQLDICENLASAIAQLWWSSNPPKRGMHWKNGKSCVTQNRKAVLDFV